GRGRRLEDRRHDRRRVAPTTKIRVPLRSPTCKPLISLGRVADRAQTLTLRLWLFRTNPERGENPSAGGRNPLPLQGFPACGSAAVSSAILSRKISETPHA